VVNCAESIMVNIGTDGTLSTLDASEFAWNAAQTVEISIDGAVKIALAVLAESVFNRTSLASAISICFYVIIAIVSRVRVSFRNDNHWFLTV